MTKPRILLVLVLLVGMILGSFMTGKAQAFVFGSGQQLSQWVREGASIIRLKDQSNDVRIGNSGNLFVGGLSGLVGVGTTNPQNKLHVEGMAGGAAGIYLNNAIPGNALNTLYNNSGTLMWNGTTVSGMSMSGAAGYLPKFTGSSALGNSIMFENAGKVGIGTTAPVSMFDVGSSLVGGSAGIYATIGPELAPSLAAGNWTLSSGWQVLSSPDRLDKNADGAGSATFSGMANVVAGTTYKVTITVDSVSGTLSYYTLGGTAGPGFTAAGTYTNYVTAINTGKLVISPWNTALRITISAISIKAVTDGTGDLAVYGKLRAYGPAYFMGSNVGIGTTAPSATLEINNGNLFGGVKIYANGGESPSINVGGAVISRNTFQMLGGSGFKFTSSGNGDSWGLSGSYEKNGVVITSQANGGAYFQHGNQLNPTIFIQSATSPATTLNEWGSLSYVGTGTGTGYFNIANGAGGISLMPLGNVGIGTVAPGSRLMIQGLTADSSASALNVTNASSTSAFYVRNDGNIGIGTTNPGYGLDVETGSIKVNNGITGLGSAGTIYIGDGTLTKAYGSGWTFVGGISQSGGSGISAVGLSISGLPGTLSVSGQSTFNGASFSGNVGIGTTAPGQLLEVAGDISIRNYGSVADGRSLLFSRTLSTYGSGTNYIGGYNANDGYMDFGNGYSTGGFRFYTQSYTYGGGSERVRIDSAGNVGIGTTNPGVPLSVQRSSNGTGLAVWLTSESNDAIQLQNTNLVSTINAVNETFNLSGYGTPIITMLGYGANAGNVGIGTVTPGERLTIKGVNNTSANAALNVTNASSTSMLYVRNDGFVGIGTTNPIRSITMYGSNPGYSIQDNQGTSNFMDVAVGSVGSGAFFKQGKMFTFGSAPNPGYSGYSSAVGTLTIDERTDSNGRLSFGVNPNGGSAKSKFDLAGNMVIGSSYAGLIAAPSNGLLVEGNVGIGTTNPGERLTIKGLDNTSANAALNVTNASSTSMLYVRNDGNIGIGVASPTRRLELNGDTGSVGVPAFLINNTDATRDSTMELRAGTAGFGIQVIGQSNPSYSNQANFYSMGGAYLSFMSDGDILSGGSAPMYFLTGGYGNNQRRMTILSTGNVGIGTTTPGYTLDVAGRINSSTTVTAQGGNIQLGQFNSLAGLYSGTADMALSQWTGSAYRASLFIQGSNGYVGIGTTSPQTKFNVIGDISSMGVGSKVWAGYGYGFIRMVEGTPATLESMYDMQFKVNGNPPATTAMYIQASTANIGIGLTNPLARLQIAGAGNDSSAAALNVTNASSTSMLYVRNDGNVGIGTTNPAYPLEINSASSLAMFRMESTNTLPANGHFSITGYTAGGFAPVYEGASFSSSYPNLAFLATGNNDTGSKEFIELSTEATVVNRPILAVRNGNFSGPVLFQINANGYVGIGTTGPREKLDVANGNIVVDTGYGLSVKYPYDSSTRSLLTTVSNGGNYDIYVGNTSGMFNDLYFSASGLSAYQAMIIKKTTGNVGIGTTNPGERLTIKGLDNTSANAALNVTNASSTSMLYVRNDGNVGIGTAAPLEKLHIFGYGPSGGGSNTFGVSTDNVQRITVIDNVANVGKIFAYDYGSFTYQDFDINNGALRIKSAGNVGIGTTNPLNRLDVEGVDGGSAGIYMNSASPLTTANTLYNASGVLMWNGGAVGGAAISGTAGYLSKFTSANSLGNSLLFESGGNVGIGTTAPGEKLVVAGGNILIDGGAYIGQNAYNNVLFNTNTVQNAGQGMRFNIDSNNNETGAAFEIATDVNTLSGGTVLMRIQDNGNVGIGTAIPGYALDVNGGFRVGNATSTNGLVFNPITGNVGIGTANPTAKWVIQQSADGVANGFRVLEAANPQNYIEAFEDGVTGGVIRSSSAGGGVNRYDFTFQGLNQHFQTYYNSIWADKMTILSNGNVGIGTVSPTQLLHINTAGNTASSIKISTALSSTSGTGDAGIEFAYGGGSSKMARIVAGLVGGGGADLWFQTPTGGTGNAYSTKMTILRDGNVGIGTVAPAFAFDVAGAANTGTITFGGSGLNDATFSGTYSGSWTQTLRVQVDATGTPDTFKWSIDGGTTWAGTGVAITGSAQALNYTGISVTFGATTGHTLNAYWQATLTPPTGIVNATGGYYLGGSLFATGSINNTVVGVGALGSGKNTGRYNTAVGYYALNSNTTGYGNTGIGNSSLTTNTTGYNNTAYGNGSLYFNTTGYSNTATGLNSLYNNTTGYWNTANGLSTLLANTTGVYNNASGAYALTANTIGNYNSANGTVSLMSNTTGSQNTGAGVSALQSNITGNANTSIGFQSLYSNTTGSNNLANGFFSLYYNTTGNYNTANGYQSLYGNVNGSNNTAYGYNAMGIKPGQPAVAVAASGSVDIGTHQYLVTYVINGIEYPSSWRAAATTAGNNTVNLSGISTYSGPLTITAKRVYRTVVAGGAWATVTVSGGAVTGVTLGGGGSGYDSTAVVALTPKDAGTGATITATGILGGVIQQSNLTITNGGSGYTVAPTVIISKYPANDPNKFYKVEDLGLSDATYSDTQSDVAVIANGALPAGMSNSIMLGANATAYGSNQFVIGDSQNPINDTYFGGVYRFDVGAGISHTLHAMGGNGTDQAGGNLIFAAGQGTGAGLGGSLVFQTASATSTASLANALTERMRILGNGNVGIGTNSPAQLLSLSNALVANIRLQNSGYGTSSYLGTNGTGLDLSNNAYYNGASYIPDATVVGAADINVNRGYIAFNTQSTATNPIVWNEAMRIISSGNVGIGTAGPVSTLEVRKDVVGSLGPTLTLSNWGGGVGSGANIDFVSTSNGVIISRIGAVRTDRVVNGDSALAFSTWSNGTLGEKMRILDNGNVGIGTTNTGRRLDVVDAGSGEQFHAGNGAGYFFAGAGASSATIGAYNTTYLPLTINPGGNVYLAPGSGSVGIGTTAPSDKFSVYNGSAMIDHGNLKFTQETAPGVLTAADSGSGSGGPNGTYTYRVTFITAIGETQAGSISGAVTVADHSISLSSIPTGTVGVVTGRNIYRTVNGGTIYYRLGSSPTINDNTTTVFTDSVADGSLNATVVPKNNTTAGGILVGGTTRLQIDQNGNIGIGTVSPSARLQSMGNMTANWAGDSTYYGGGKSGAFNIYGDQYGNGSPYTYGVTNMTQTISGLYGGLGGGYFKGGDASYGGGGAGIVAIGGNGANPENVNSGGGAGLFAKGGLNGSGSYAFAGYFAGGNLAVMQGSVGIGTSAPGGLLQVTQPTTGLGTVTVTAAGTVVTGVNTQFLNTFKVGDTITAGGETHTISAIASNTSLTTDAWTNATSTVAYTLTGGNRFAVMGNGNVGIGTTAPGAFLDIKGSYSTNHILIGDWAYSNFYTAIGLANSLNSANANFISGITDTNLYINRPLGKNINFTENGYNGSTWNSQMTIAAGGNVGIGTTGPTSLFQVAQVTTGVGTVTVTASGTTVTGTGTQFLNTFKVGDTITANSETHTISAIASNTSLTTDAWTNAASTVAYTLVGGNRFAVLGNGNVGIGTTNPINNLEITGGKLVVGSGSMGAGINGFGINMGGSNKFAKLISGTSGVGYMFDNSGYFTIFAASSFAADGTGSTNYYKVFGNTGNTLIGNNSAATADTNYKLNINAVGSAGYLAVTNSVNGDIFNINASGNVGIGTTGPGGAVAGCRGE